MEKNQCQIAALQETFLSQKSNLKSDRRYTLLRKDREKDKGGGIAFIVRNDIQFRTIDIINPDDHTEIQGIEVKLDESIAIFNIYIPPASSCASGFSPVLEDILETPDAIFLGDFNGHSECWNSELSEDNRGAILAEMFDSAGCVVLNGNEPTREQKGKFSSPDISIASASLAMSASWRCITALSSDHKPILVDIGVEEKFVKAEKRVFINFSKADWPGFQQYVEERIKWLPKSDNIHVCEKALRQLLLKSSKKYIPKGRIPKVRPFFPADAIKMGEERDRLRTLDPESPRIGELNKQINNLVSQHKRDKWRLHLEDCDLGKGSKKLWTTIKGLSGKMTTTNSQAITFDKPVFGPSECSRKFNQQYTPSTANCSAKAHRPMYRERKKNKDLCEFPEISIAEIKQALKTTRASKALGPDQLSPIMLKHLGPEAMGYMAFLFNLSVRRSIIPNIWKTGKIIPLLKPGKPADLAKSYRPVSLLSPMIKTLEKTILPHLDKHLLMAYHQHGFRSGRSTTTALMELDKHITDGLNSKRPPLRTVVVALDMRAAFDTVNINTLLGTVLETNMPNPVKRWLCAYLRGRQTFTEFRGEQSGYRKVRSGVPQGGVLSPALFNAYMARLPTPPDPVHITTYADDCTVYVSGVNIEDICRHINSYLCTLATWLEENQLELSPGKSSATIFTNSTKEVSAELPVVIGSEKIPTVKNPTILGVTFDPLHTFSEHTRNVRKKLQKKNNVLSALAGSTWGKDKELICTTYKTIGRSVANYAAPVWTPSVSETNWSRLQSCQNAALRTATGQVRMTQQEDLHRETMIIPLKNHNHLLSKQFLLQTYKPSHPNQNLHQHRSERQIKRTLKTCYDDAVESLVNYDDPKWYKRGMIKLHTTAVRETIDKYRPNKVINDTPPKVAEDEKRLPRRTRAQLAQLRSGYSKLLMSYRSRIETVADECPECHSSPHDTAHLFNCPAKPTNLEVLSLWNEPIAAAQFLGLETSEI